MNNSVTNSVSQNKVANLFPREQLPMRLGDSQKIDSEYVIDRLTEYKGEVCRFADNPLVPFTKNHAERDLRMIKMKNKVIGSFRLEQSAKDFLILKSFSSAASKAGFTPFDALLSLLFGPFSLVTE